MMREDTGFTLIDYMRVNRPEIPVVMFTAGFAEIGPEGRAMQERVKHYYDLKLVDEAYAAIYRHHSEAPTQTVAHG